MRVLSDAAVHPNRIILPVLDTFPHNPILGELIYFNKVPHNAIMIFTGEGWIPLYSTRNNIWEEHVAEMDQKIFELANEFDTDGNSIVVYKDGVRLEKSEYVELGRNLIAYRGVDIEGEDIDILGGEVFQFQIFNVKTVGVFDVKSFNRRNGLC